MEVRTIWLETGNLCHQSEESKERRISKTKFKDDKFDPGGISLTHGWIS